MELIAFPVRINSRGWLQRCDTAEAAIVSVFKIMARTSSLGGWRGVPDFGLREALAEMGLRRSLHTDVITSLNRALAELGIDWFGVDSVVREPGSEMGRSSFTINVTVSGKGADAVRLEL
jgi:hypothetical protein